MSKIKYLIARIKLKQRYKIILGAIIGAIALNFIVGKITGVSLLTAIKNLINGEQVEVKMITIESSGYKTKEPGSWHIEKSADWTGTNKAKVVFDVDTVMKPSGNQRDVIFVIDISGSMEGDKLNRVKEDVKELTTSLLSNGQNKVALITFDTSSQIVSNFTTNKNTIINAIDSLSVAGVTNYYQALTNVDEILETYKKENNKDVVVLFLTDGYPNRETPNEIAQYKLLKQKYPYLTINGIQYEMGTRIIDDIKNISDNQYIAGMENLENVLFEAALTPEFYESFEIVDYVNNEYFEVVSQNDIKVSIGTVKLTVESDGTQKITWTVGKDQLRTGSSMKMEIDLKLKAKHVEETEGFYPTNKKEEISSKLYDESKKTTTSNDVPILKRGYKLIYDPNYPKGCNINWSKEEKHYAYQTVDIGDAPTVCDGYVFHGWDTQENVTMVNDDYFIMPGNDIHLVGKWGKLGIAKSMDGTVWEKLTLYKTIELEAKKPNGQAKQYIGDVDDTFEGNANKNVYYYTGDNIVNNNVIFGEHCWQIVRTTATGGVKLLYNGVPKAGKCTAKEIDRTIGTSSFNPADDSLAYVGYMYNKVYSYKKDYYSNNYIYSTDISYDGTNYTLSGSQIKGRGDTYHYSCGDNSKTTCEKVRFYFADSNYIELDDTVNSIEEAIYQMLHASDVNSKDSTIKGVIDNWYVANLQKYGAYLEDTIFCNDRSIISLGAWSPSGSLNFDENVYLKFKEYNLTTDLTCERATDKFSTKNPVAELKYPIGLLTAPEANLMGSDNARSIGWHEYWLSSAYMFDYTGFSSNVSVRVTGFLRGAIDSVDTYYVRPVVSLKPDIDYVDGDGTAENPFVIFTN